MRIAISGSHNVGKSTLIDEFLLVYPEYVHEPEPYIVLVEDLGEEFSAKPCVEDFLRQLDFNIDRLTTHARGEKVIYERCPLDFLAYIDALEPGHSESLIGPVSAALNGLDLLVFLPLEQPKDLEYRSDPDVDYPRLRKAVDQRLNAIILDDELGMISTPVVEARGSTAQRLKLIQDAMKTFSRSVSI